MDYKSSFDGRACFERPGRMSGPTGDGYFVILGGDEAGEIVEYEEVGFGYSTDLSLQVEVGRVDYTGNIEDFGIQLLTGYREKIWGGVAVGKVTSIGVSHSWSKQENRETVYGTAVSFGIGTSILDLFLNVPASFGYNEGMIYRK